MATGPRINAARNIIAGVLGGCGAASFFCFIALDILWSRAAPRQPNEALGLVYRHNEHGSYTYFSAFQATACGLMFMTSIALGSAGAFIAPRKNLLGPARRYGARFKWERDDPGDFLKWTALVSVAVAPLFVFFIGPYIIRGLNAAGFVMNLG